jgi:type IX secretion system PorP/SprF family membrane protein
MQGEERVTSFMLSYAYRYSFKKGSVAFGISGGIIQKAVDGSKLRSPEGVYGSTVEHNDDFIPGQLSSGFTGDMNAGIYFQTKKMYAGISVNNLVESAVKLQGQGQQSDLKNPRFYTIIAGYKLKVGKKLSLIPNVCVRTDFVNVQPEFNTILQYKDNIYGGASFRGIMPDSKDALILMFGFKILKNLRLGYSYDFSLSSLNNSNSGSHEVYVQYGIRIKDLVNPGKVIYNPRFL